jgi:hypothetical protein
MKKTTAPLTGMVLLLLAACAQAVPPTATPVPTPAPTPTPDIAAELIGVWHESKPGWGEAYLGFKEDGTYRMAIGTAEDLVNDRKVEGQFWFEGDHLMLKDIAGTAYFNVCVLADPPIGKFTAQVRSDGNLELTAIEDECYDRADFMTGEYEPDP